MESWVPYAGLTVVCWGLYGIFLGQGAEAMHDPVNGRLKAFLLVGVAYFLVAILAPLAILLARGASLAMPGEGATWSLVAGMVGAVGALGVLLAMGAKGQPAVVMAIVFAGAPIVNSVVAVTRAGAWGQVRWPFVLGIVLAAVGGGLVNAYKPGGPPPRPAAPAESPTP